MTESVHWFISAETPITVTGKVPYPSYTYLRLSLFPVCPSPNFRSYLFQFLIWIYDKGKCIRLTKIIFTFDFQVRKG